jgi:hypothetical protein
MTQRDHRTPRRVSVHGFFLQVHSAARFGAQRWVPSLPSTPTTAQPGTGPLACPQEGKTYHGGEKKMRSLHEIVRSLVDLPRGFSADGRPIGLGLDAALKAQRAIGADVQQAGPDRRPAAELTDTRAS